MTGHARAFHGRRHLLLHVVAVRERWRQAQAGGYSLSVSLTARMLSSFSLSCASNRPYRYRGRGLPAETRLGCLVGHIFRPAPHTGLTYKRSRKSPWSAWFWCISPKSSWLPRVLSVSVCGPISGCPPDLTSPPPLIHPLAAADGHAGGAFDSALGGRNDGQARSMGPQTDVRSRLGRYLCVGSVQREGIHGGKRPLRAETSV